MNDVAAEEARPWSPESGPRPRVTVYNRGREPALWVYAAGQWRYAVARARLDHADGRTAYRVNITLPDAEGGEDAAYSRAYWWPQPGLRAGHGPGDRRRAGRVRALDAA